MKTSLIISTYNWPAALEAVLRSVTQQTRLPDEVLIADDGSGEETATLVKTFQEKFPVPLLHLWHADKGFRLSAVRNLAIKKAKFEYIIQIDGDVVLHPDFVKEHLHFAEKNCFITGSRVLMDDSLSKQVLAQKTKPGFLASGIGNRLNALHFPLFNLLAKKENSPLNKMTTGIRGCNMSFWRDDLLAINGYDEDFVGWGREDSEIVVRLIKKGCYRKKIKMAAIQYHIYHKENAKDNLESNHQLMEQAIADQSFRVKNGIEK